MQHTERIQLYEKMVHALLRFHGIGSNLRLHSVFLAKKAFCAHFAQWWQKYNTVHIAKIIQCISGT